MNLHKAKGLEAPVVFLANPVGLAPHLHTPVRHIMRTDETGPLGYFLCRRKWGRQWKTLSQPESWNEKFLDEEGYQEAEERRLMYVAATRARNILVVSSYEHNLGDKRAWGILDDALGDVPELEIPMKAKVAPREKLVVEKGELKTARVALAEKISAGNRPGYRVEAVTALAKRGLTKEDRELPERARYGLGMSWGRVVHSVLNILGKEISADQRKYKDEGKIPDIILLMQDALTTENIDLLIENALSAEDIDLREKGRLWALIDNICTSDLWQRALQAEKHLFEVPFSIETESRELELEGDLHVILSGAIDLVFKEEDGWVIADYKTDEIVGGLQSYVDYYAPQIRLYSRFWTEITAEPVKESGLYFTSLNRWIPL
jgi:ATP-dependent helicase/nuclease subunit A